MGIVKSSEPVDYEVGSFSQFQAIPSKSYCITTGVPTRINYPPSDVTSVRWIDSLDVASNSLVTQQCVDCGIGWLRLSDDFLI